MPMNDAQREIYKTVDEVQLALYLFKPSKKPPVSAVVFFFGGGWVGGTPEQFAPQARYLASRGMLAACAEYRVKSRHNTSPYEAVKDAKSAIRWLRANADRLGIDADRLAAGGGSAGGHLAAATALIHNLNEETDDLNVSAVPNALLLFNPVYDNGQGGFGGGRFADISPMHHIERGMPPAVVFLGEEDGLIPVKTARRFQQKMRSAGSRSELFLYKGQPHGFFNALEFKPDADPRCYYETLLETDRFLTSLGFLEKGADLTPPKFTLETNGERRQLEIAYGGKPLARYEYAYDPSTSESRHDTYKPFLHVYSKNGARLITKGAGGLFTHHRGIFHGYNHFEIDGKRRDLWHMKEGVQVHRRFLRMHADENGAEFTSQVEWMTNEGETLLTEARTHRFLPPLSGAYALIEMRSELAPIAGDARLSGDPEHAGAQFRPADDIVADETEYLFHEEKIDPTKDHDLPWVSETFRLSTSAALHSVLVLNHPDNPRGTVFSAYRDYGRFGAFPTLEIPKGDTAELRYRWIVSGGKALPKETAEEAYRDFAGSGENG